MLVVSLGVATVLNCRIQVIPQRTAALWLTCSFLLSLSPSLTFFKVLRITFPRMGYSGSLGSSVYMAFVRRAYRLCSS